MTPIAARGGGRDRDDFAGLPLLATSGTELLAELREVLHDEPRRETVGETLPAAVDPRGRDAGLLRRLEVVEDGRGDVELPVGARPEPLARLVEMLRRRLV